jgi:hypothetical protein
MKHGEERIVSWGGVHGFTKDPGSPTKPPPNRTGRQANDMPLP